MNSKQLKELLRKKKVKLIDVREKEEFKKTKERIKGAKNIPMGRVFLMHSLKKLSKKEKIVVCCLYGSRSTIVARELKKKGYNIDVLKEGIKNYIN